MGRLIHPVCTSSAKGDWHPLGTQREMKLEATCLEQTRKEGEKRFKQVCSNVTQPSLGKRSPGDVTDLQR